MGTPSSLKSGKGKKKLAARLWTVTGRVAVPVSDPDCPWNVMLRLPGATVDANRNVTFAAFPES